jgi:hypothetical protein
MLMGKSKRSLPHEFIFRVVAGVRPPLQSHRGNAAPTRPCYRRRGSHIIAMDGKGFGKWR